MHRIAIVECQTDFKRGEGWKTDCPIRTANAQLMAAAPDLLEALQILYAEQVDYIKLNHLGDPHHNRSMQLAREAIRLATEVTP